MQLTGITATGVNLTYNYPAGANIGKIQSMTDGITGETVTYMYDTLNRLTQAETASWGQSYSYDGFGNLTSKNVIYGMAPSPTVSVNSTTNQLNGSDANGNYGGTFDVENRMAWTYYPGTGGGAYFGYDTQNRQVWQWDGVESTPAGNPTQFTVYFYGIDGKRLAAYTINSHYIGTQQNITGYGISVGATQQEMYFGSWRLAPMDRVGSARGTGTDSGGYYPFGEDKGTMVANDSWKFGGYWRDLVTGLDYAGARYYSSTMGRFMSADPYWGSAMVTAPQSWNRFSYVLNDPTNTNDPDGLGGPCDPLGPGGTYEGSAPSTNCNYSENAGYPEVPAISSVTVTCPPDCGSVMGTIDQYAGMFANAIAPVTNTLDSYIYALAAASGTGVLSSAVESAAPLVAGALSSAGIQGGPIESPQGQPSVVGLLPAAVNGLQWTGDITVTVTESPLTMYRVYGNTSPLVGGWLTPNLPTSPASAISSLSLPPGNTAEFISQVTVPAETLIQSGTSAPLFGQPGGGAQVLLLQRIPPVNFAPGIPLGR